MRARRIFFSLQSFALLMFTRRRDLMGEFVNGTLTNVLAIVGAAVVLALNAFLIWDVVTG